MKITSQWLDGYRFVATTESGHSVVMEGTATEDAIKRGPSPMEMLQLGLAGCSSIDIVMIAEKQRQDIVDCQATVEAKRADSPPKVFTDIHIHFKVLGRNLKQETIAKAVSMSAEKYCSASIMLSKAANITHSFEVVEV